jgi:transmembrane 9 superfamily protein 2/4
VQVYVGYMVVVSMTFFLITGALGFVSCFIFVRQIYSAIKID